MTGEPTSEALYVAFASGDVGAFDVLYARHAGDALTMVRRESPDDREEIAQDAWLRIVENSRELSGNGDEFIRNLAWAVMNAARVHKHGSQLTSRLSESHQDQTPSPELALSIRQAIDRMDDEPKRVFLLVVDGLSLREASKEAGMNRETARRRFNEALASVEHLFGRAA